MRPQHQVGVTESRQWAQGMTAAEQTNVGHFMGIITVPNKQVTGAEENLYMNVIYVCNKRLYCVVYIMVFVECHFFFL